MILARVALGRPGAGAIGVRKPEKGCHSVSELRMDVQGKYYIHAIFDNHQAYPEFLLYYI